MGTDPGGSSAVRWHVRERKSDSAEQLRSTHRVRMATGSQRPIGREGRCGHLLRSRRYQQNGSLCAGRIALRGYDYAAARYREPAESVSRPAVKVITTLVRLHDFNRLEL